MHSHPFVYSYSLLRRAWATSFAIAQLAILDRTLSARLVKITGTLAPSTIPALSAFARKLSSFARMLPASRSGASRMSGSPATVGDYSWPGNIRELANVVERAVINSTGRVLRIADQLEPLATSESASAKAKTLVEVERDYIIRTLEEVHWKIEGPHGAAEILGLNPSTLRTRMAKLRIRRSAEVAHR